MALSSNGITNGNELLLMKVFKASVVIDPSKLFYPSSNYLYKITVCPSTPPLAEASKICPKANESFSKAIALNEVHSASLSLSP